MTSREKESKQPRSGTSRTATGRIRRWGASYGVVIPKTICQQLEISTDTEVGFELVGDKIVIEKAAAALQPRPRRPWREIVAGLKPENAAGASEWDDVELLPEESV